MRSGLAFDESPPRAGSAPHEESSLGDRLRACSRLMEVAADELTALTAGDLVKRRELAMLRDELISEIHDPRRAADDEDDDGTKTEERHDTSEKFLLLLPQEVGKLLAEALYELEERDEEVRRMQDRWSLLEEDALKAIHVGGRIVALRAGRYPDQKRSDANLDLRF